MEFSNFRVPVILTTLLFVCGTGYGSRVPPSFLESPKAELKPESYDFIIVGAGSAGSVIANRLSEVGQWNILLIEAGGTEGSLAKVPAMAGLLQQSQYDWKYVTEPELHACLGMVDHRCASPRGKVLGGSSGINSMVYTRGNPGDYDYWASFGNPGWSYADVLPYFLKAEDAHLTDANENYHRQGGPLSVENAYKSELADAFITAGKELGYKITDYNSPEQTGFSKIQATLKRGRRHSTNSGYLEPILHRKNLKILTEAFATKILIDHVANRAYGVEYTQGNKTYAVRATKEVILSASVYSSPQLLMLSGIGPKHHLEEHGIRTLYDLPVGQTLVNHLAFGGLVITTNFTNHDDSDFNPFTVLEWETTGKGPLTSASGTEALAFLNTGATYSGEYPDIEVTIQPGGSFRTHNGTIARKNLRISDDFYNKMYASSDETPTFTITSIILHPKSVGFLKLKSTNPHDYPLICANYLSDPEKHDVRTLVAAIRFTQKLVETNAFKKYGAKIDKKHFVGCEHHKYDSDEYWECAVRLIAFPISHQMSTCKMGPAKDPAAVVNHDLKVHGLKNLRVADTSIIAVSLSAHTNAPAVMIGEKAADIIKKEWRV